MSKLYDFRRLVTKYSNSFTLVRKAEGSYQNGRYQEGEETQETKRGAIIPFTQRKIYQSGGYLTATDRQLYMLERIEGALTGAKVIYKGKTYSIEEDTDYTDFSDVSVYILKWVEKK